MEMGRCRSCGRAYSAGEVTGLGVLRSRPASEGGPRIELECPGCKTVLVFVPHGNGRYSPPGEPPPPPPSEAERLPPWRKDPAAARSVRGPVGAPLSAREPAPAAAGTPAPPAGTRGPSRSAPGLEDVAPTLVDPLEACRVLGVSPTADAVAVDAAYREKALQCHPDKVAHLDPDIQALARRKFLRLQEARDLLLGDA